jgi:hypothetical protein
MATKSSDTLEAQALLDQKLHDGLTKNQSAIASIMIASKVVSLADVQKTLETRIDLYNAAAQAKAAWQKAVQAANDERASTKAFVSALRQSLGLMFKGSIDTLADFGLKPPKPRTPLTGEQLVAAKAKAKATRLARGTMSPKAKAKIKGAPPTAPATSPGQPAASAPAPVTAAPAPSVAAGKAGS